jgi:hypothetical protein
LEKESSLDIAVFSDILLWDVIGNQRPLLKN